MKIESRGIVITNMPGFERITVTAEGRAEIIYAGVWAPRWFSLSELTEMRDALTTAIEHVQQMAPRSLAGRKPRAWLRTEPATEPPEGVTRVRDKDGDVWTWDPDSSDSRWILVDYGLFVPWEWLLDYAPLTEVIE